MIVNVSFWRRFLILTSHVWCFKVEPESNLAYCCAKQIGEECGGPAADYFHKIYVCSFESEHPRWNSKSLHGIFLTEESGDSKVSVWPTFTHPPWSKAKTHPKVWATYRHWSEVVWLTSCLLFAAVCCSDCVPSNSSSSTTPAPPGPGGKHRVECCKGGVWEEEEEGSDRGRGQFFRNSAGLEYLCFRWWVSTVGVNAAADRVQRQYLNWKERAPLRHL